MDESVETGAIHAGIPMFTRAELKECLIAGVDNFNLKIAMPIIF